MFTTADQQRSDKLDMPHNSEQKVDAAFRRPAIAQSPMLYVRLLSGVSL
jgi:hypothetical protein